MQLLREFLECVSILSKPKFWSGCVDRIEKENRHLRHLLNKDSVTIYGANTLTGHRDNEKITNAELSFYQEDLLRTHAIGESPWLSAYAARCITYAKLYSWSAGMSGVSPALFNLLVDLACDPSFKPMIPTNCSYSCGDVIPASHWARDILQNLKQKKQYVAQPGEIMALINGHFIQVGYAASIINKIRTSWVFYIELSAIINNITQANSSNLFFFTTAERSWASTTVEYIRSRSTKRSIIKDVQDPVTLRAIPQTVELICNSIEEYLREINYSLLKPSGNPLFDTTSDHPISQASFLAPVLSIKTGALIESILFVMWSMIGRTNYLLSGEIPGIPRDASNNNSTLGLIQYPKLMMAKLEKSRANYGRRLFASGSQTSYGVEDLWSNGITVLGQLENLIEDFLYLCGIELYMINYIDKNLGRKLDGESEMIKLTKDCESPSELVMRVSECIDEGGMKDVKGLFPIKT